ncbi:MAG: tetratricopeptide repeat protein [Caldilineaceae bacterium]
MTQQADAELRNLLQQLPSTEDAVLAHFRARFFEGLERRRLDDCQSVLDLLGDVPSPRLRQEQIYHQAILHSERRELDQAEVCLRRLLAQETPPDETAKTWLVLGIVLNEQGAWTEAEGCFRTARDGYAAIGDRLGESKALNNTGIAIFYPVEQGIFAATRLSEAVDCHRAALDLLAQESDGPRGEEALWETGRNWHGLGMIYGMMGKHEAALNAFQQHVALCRELDDPGDTALGLSDMAALAYAPLGQRDAAQAALDEAIHLFNAHPDPLNLAEALTRRGNLHATADMFDAAESDFADALHAVEAVQAQLTTPVVQSNYRAMLDFVYAAPLSHYLRRGDGDAAFTLAERARSRVLAGLLAGQSEQPHVGPPADLVAERAAVRAKLDAAYAADHHADQARRLEAELAAVDRRIELLDPAYAGPAGATSLTADAICRALPQDTLLLTYVRDEADHLWILMADADGVDDPCRSPICRCAGSRATSPITSTAPARESGASPTHGPPGVVSALCRSTQGLACAGGGSAVRGAEHRDRPHRATALCAVGRADPRSVICAAAA